MALISSTRGMGSRNDVLQSVQQTTEKRESRSDLVTTSNGLEREQTGQEVVIGITSNQPSTAEPYALS